MQPGQPVFISAPVECADLARRVTKACYDLGAREVTVSWTDDTVRRLRYLYADDTVFDTFPASRREELLEKLRDDGCRLAFYTSPHRDGTNGRVYGARPLVYAGSLIEDYWIDFQNGRAVNCAARIGEVYLKELLAVDEGACKLGEVALVPYHSPISLMNTPFYSPLYDENASCHFALGLSFDNVIDGGPEMDPETRLSHGLNMSQIHVDFMIGTEDTDIMGYDTAGREIPVFEKGDFAGEIQMLAGMR